ncbi:hypothetical protein M426DRAFT_7879 [Hypoxylon sp. CI-4A]|nr:hypothetical protein M426DRAFT_7879 [Hypoxylon sp. CI-4A]
MSVDDRIVDPLDGMESYIKGNHWALPYFSNHYHENPPQHAAMLDHVNCGYLSTPGRPPTLEALKQHAQSLTYLISTLSPSMVSGEIDNENTPYSDNPFPAHEAYDWLNNLQEPYDNIDKAHRQPLNSLVNLVKKATDSKGIEFHCPMDELNVQLVETSNMESYRPFFNHMTLLMHANDCLERLDHELSAIGGIMSVLPTDEENVEKHPDIEKAKSTLVGQWLLFTQHLMTRMHELEISYANSLDLLANEAVVPAQQMSAYGPDARSGREVVFPQDRWVLANAGDDVFTYIHQVLDKREAYSKRYDDEHIKQNVVGDTLFSEDNSEKLRGLVSVDLSTRFYRLKGSGHGPIFVLPGFSDRPGTAHTRDLEEQPIAMTLPTPSLPTAVTAYEKRYGNLHAEVDEKIMDNNKLQMEVTNLRDSVTAQADELARVKLLNLKYEENQGVDAAQLGQKMQTTETDRNEWKNKYEANLAELAKAQSELAAYKKVTRENNSLQPFPDVTKEGNQYKMNKSMYRLLQGRATVVEEIKPEVQRVRSIILMLAEEGRIDLGDFSWMLRLGDIA